MTDETAGPGPEAEDDAFTIGRELADAREAERRREGEDGGDSSPLPEGRYDFWRGDHSLLNPAPNPLDAGLRETCKKYAKEEKAERERTRKSISMDELYTLITFAMRSSVFALRESSARPVEDGLTALAMIEQERVDYRDILVALGLLYHAAERAGGNAGEMFRAAAGLAEQKAAAMFVSFAEGTADYRSLQESWGYDEVTTGHGAGFIGRGYADYEPGVDIQSAAVDVSHLVSADAYQVSRVEVAAEFPEVWLGNENSLESERVLSAAPAAASVSAKLRPEQHPDHGSQHFSVFLVETAAGSDAEALRRFAASCDSPAHARLPLARGRLFCLIVARSFVEGVEAFETDESLARFSSALTAILDRYAGP